MHTIYVISGNETGKPDFVIIWLSKKLFSFLENSNHFVLMTGASSQLIAKKLRKTTDKFSFLENFYAYIMWQVETKLAYLTLSNFNLVKRYLRCWKTKSLLFSE